MMAQILLLKERGTRANNKEGMSRSEYVRPATPGPTDALRVLLTDRWVGYALTLLSALLALWSVYRIAVWLLFHLRRLAEAWVGTKKAKTSDDEGEEEDDSRTVRRPERRHR